MKDGGKGSGSTSDGPRIRGNIRAMVEAVVLLAPG